MRHIASLVVDQVEHPRKIDRREANLILGSGVIFVEWIDCTFACPFIVLMPSKINGTV